MTGSVWPNQRRNSTPIGVDCPPAAVRRTGTRSRRLGPAVGLLVERATPDAFADAMFEIGRRSFDLSAMRARAEMFGRDRFESQFASLVAETSATLHAAC